MKGSGDDRKPSANEEEHPAPTIRSRISYFSPTIEAAVPLIISIRYLPQSSQGAYTDYSGNVAYMQDEEETSYGNYLGYIPVMMFGTFFVTTFFCNLFLGRAPSRDSHHNPFYHKIIQGAGEYMPAVSAVLYSIFRFGARTIGGERAEAVEGIISKALAALNILNRVDDKVDESYDYRMDRSAELDGNVRRIEYIDIVIRDGIVYLVELGLHGLYYAIEMRLTRIAINDENRLYIITALYSGADTIEESLIYLLNQHTYYAQRIVDFQIISSLLQFLGIADPSRPIKAATPRAIDQVDKKIKKGMEEFSNAVKKAGNDFKEGAEELSEDIKEGFEKAGDKLHYLGENIQHSFEAVGDGIARALHIPHLHHNTHSSNHTSGASSKAGEQKASSSSSTAAEKKGAPKDDRNYEDKKPDGHSSSSSTNVANAEQEDDFMDDIHHNFFYYFLYGVFHALTGGVFNHAEADEEIHHGEAAHELGAQELIHNLLHGAHESVAVGTEGFGPFAQVVNNPNGSMTGTLSNGARLNFPIVPDSHHPELGFLTRFTDHARNLGHVGGTRVGDTRVVDTRVFSYYDDQGNIVIMIGDVEIKILPPDHHS